MNTQIFNPSKAKRSTDEEDIAELPQTTKVQKTK